MSSNTSNPPKKLWSPSSSFKEQSNLNRFAAWLREDRQLDFSDYQSLWQWSVEHTADFWRCIWDYFEVKSHAPYTRVVSNDPMPDTRWFEGSLLNYTEHLFRHSRGDHPAILFRSERHPLRAISWEELRSQVVAVQAFLRSRGVEKGDRVAAYLPNIPEATVAMLATTALGAIWSSCSPDFGLNSVVDRFRQIEPKVLIAVDGYQYNGKPFDKTSVVRDLCSSIESIESVLFVPYLNEKAKPKGIPAAVLWEEALDNPASEVHFEPLPFDHPIWVLYSSGTTGSPKAITHGHGGMLLEHYKYLAFHNDVHPGERFFWFSTTGWMMWNFVHASMLMGATIVLYDGSPGYPDLKVLWELTERAGIHHFGTSAPFLVACMRAGQKPGKAHDLRQLRSIGSTGSPLPLDAFEWVYERVKPNLWLCSMSGGTDVCTAFVGGCPWEPVNAGEIQCRGLGCALYAFDEEGRKLVEEVGEMVITQPMPCMPVFFWGDEDKERYRSSYFEHYPGIWRHGDWIWISRRGTLVIKGRSDATLNRQGVRIGTAEIYRAMNKVEAVKDSLIINLELGEGRDYMPLFVILKEGEELNEALVKEIKTLLRKECSPRHVPDEIIAAPDVPYTISGKKMETPVKKILMGQPPGKSASKDAMRNPESLDFFSSMYERIKR